MTLLMTGLWQLAIAVIIFSHISAALPSLERHQRQVELKLMHEKGLIRELEKSFRYLEELMDSKRSVPNTPGPKDASGFIGRSSDGSWSSEDKLIKLKTCLQFVQHLDRRFSDKDTKDATRVISSICQLIAQMNEMNGTPADENQE